MLKILRNLKELRQETTVFRSQGERYAIVPTMGALHEGHIRLVTEAKTQAERVLVSIFVNPKQFGVGEDLSRYPRDEKGDIAQLKKAGVDIVYAPPPEEVYSEGFATSISMSGPAKANLEDKFRPHFFDGVATVVAKLLTGSGADYALFGEKDYQQLAVVRRLTLDLDIPTEIIGVPTVRAEDGLALSSRNRYLSKAERAQAPAIHRLLTQAADKINNGLDPQKATHAAARSLTTLGFKVDYVAARDAQSLALPEPRSSEPLRLLAAAWLGTTRLIDNISV